MFCGFGGINLQEFSSEPIEMTAEPSQHRSWLLFLREFLETLLLAVGLFVVIEAISARVRVEGFSMLPTLQNGELVLVSKISYRFAPIRRGDIVVFRHPLDPKQELIKRVIGLPGDTIHIQDKQVVVNGMVIQEPYIAAPPRYNGEWKVPPGNLFVLGDNRNDSSDSHSWGLLPVDHVIGKAILVYWPLPRIRFLEHPALLDLVPSP